MYVRSLPSTEDATRFGVLKMNSDNRITQFDEKPMAAMSHTISCGIYVIRRRQLIELIERSIEEGRHDFVKDVLIRYKDVKRIYGYKLRQLLEQYRIGGVLLQDEHGFPEKGSPGLLLQGVSGCAFQGGR